MEKLMAYWRNNVNEQETDSSVLTLRKRLIDQVSGVSPSRNYCFAFCTLRLTSLTSCFAGKAGTFQL